MFDSLSPSFGPSPLQRTGATTALLTSRSPVPRTGSPFQASGEISPGKNAVLRRTTAEFTPPGPWPSRLRGLLPARPARRRLVSGSCPSACGLRYRLPSYARSPLRSCRSLRFRWPDYGRTCTSKTAPMLGAQRKRTGPYDPVLLSSASPDAVLFVGKSSQTVWWKPARKDARTPEKPNLR
jgi:hypothetical protein